MRNFIVWWIKWKFIYSLHHSTYLKYLKDLYLLIIHTWPQVYQKFISHLSKGYVFHCCETNRSFFSCLLIPNICSLSKPKESLTCTFHQFAFRHLNCVGFYCTLMMNMLAKNKLKKKIKQTNHSLPIRGSRICFKILWSIWRQISK